MSRTIDDWVELAASTHADQHLAAAEALANSAWEWRRLFNQARKHGVGDLDWRRRVTDSVLAASIADREVWGFRDVAAARKEWGDLPGARDALEAGIISLAPDGLSCSWTILAKGFINTLADHDGARTCLELCRRADLQARCDVATARAELLGEHDQATAILRALRPADASEAWTLGNAWKSLGQPNVAEQVFEEVLAREPSFRDVLRLARAWSSHERPEGCLRAIERAEARASTPTEWIDLAETCLDLDHPERIPPALQRAQAAGPLDASLRASLAAAWLWIGDSERAEQIGPRGRRPADLRPIHRTLAGVEPDAAALFDDLRARISDTSLRQLAGADYGSGYDKHLAALEDLCRTGRIPEPLPWEPGEVLRLVRWYEGERVDHLARGLSCVVLCLSGGELANDAAPLVETALAMGDPAPREAEGLFAWCHASEADDAGEQQLIALWALALLRAAHDPHDTALDVLADEAERVISTTETTFEDALKYSLRRPMWQELSARLFDPASAPGARWLALVSSGLGDT